MKAKEALLLSNAFRYNMGKVYRHIELAASRGLTSCYFEEYGSDRITEEQQEKLLLKGYKATQHILSSGLTLIEVSWESE